MPEQGKEKLNACFFVTPIGEAESDARIRADAVLAHILRPALVPSVVAEVTRADLEPRSGFITSTVIEKIVRSRIVVADITGLNPNVFYELAIAHAAQVPVVTIREPNAAIPFDISALSAIDCGLDIAGGTAAIQSIRTAAERLLNDPSQVESPVKTALLLLNSDTSTAGKKTLEAELLRRFDRLESAILRSSEIALRPPAPSYSFDDDGGAEALLEEVNRLNALAVDMGRGGGGKREVDHVIARRNDLLARYENLLNHADPDLPSLRHSAQPPRVPLRRDGKI